MQCFWVAIHFHFINDYEDYGKIWTSPFDSCYYLAVIIGPGILALLTQLSKITHLRLSQYTVMDCFTLTHYPPLLNVSSNEATLR